MSGLEQCRFPVSCTPTTQTLFNRGVALLHDFWYEEAQRQFERILKADPACAMAHWGIAMSDFHQIWDRPDAAGMSAGLARDAERAIAAARRERERAYIAALREFFDPKSRNIQAALMPIRPRWASYMQQFPGRCRRGCLLRALAAGSRVADRHQPASRTPGDGGADAAVAKYPDHPGLVHYIIHACDNPALAADGLAAANHYGEIAASGPHAVHMPGHIYARLGMWKQDIAANLASIEASKARGSPAREWDGWTSPTPTNSCCTRICRAARKRMARASSRRPTAASIAIESMPGMAARSLDGRNGSRTTERSCPSSMRWKRRDWNSASTLEPINGAPPDTQTQVYWARAIADGQLHQPDSRRVTTWLRTTL